METFSFALIVLAVVLASSLLDPWIPPFSLPLIQVGAGVLVALVVPALSGHAASMDPELFLLLFIAPLLFDEARTLSKRALARQWAPVLSLAVGLVAVTTLAVGFLLHGLVPTIPLGAALALGAALGPTDAVSVASLEGQVHLGRRASSLLSGEALLNDATGVVAFQFAVAFLAAGAVSPGAVVVSFVAAFAGGAALGAAAGLGAAWVVRTLHRDAEAPAPFYAVFDLLLPFGTYLAGHALGVSGIISVVACAIAVTLAPGPKTVATARVAGLSHDIWEVTTFALNGSVFVILGLQLPQAMSPSWTGPVPSPLLVGLALAVTGTMMGIRFLWLWAQEALHRHGGPVRERARQALLCTLAGTKGAITLSIAMTLPRFTVPGEAFPDRGALIFIASCAIIVTLLLANFLLPLLAPMTPQDRRPLDRAQAQVLEELLVRLDEGIQLNEGNEAMARALALTQRTYEHRLERVRGQGLSWRERRERTRRDRARAKTRRDEAACAWAGSDEELEALNDLVAECEARSLHIELDVIRDLTIEGEISPEEARALRERVYVMQITLAG